MDRQKFVTLVLIFVGEILVLAYWGLMTPGQVVPTGEAVLVLGGTAVLVSIISFGVYILLDSRGKDGRSPKRGVVLRSSRSLAGLAFVLLIAVGSIAIGSSFDSAVNVILNGESMMNLIHLGLSVALLGAAVLCTLYFLYRLELATGSVKRRIHFFEVGWRTNDSY